MECSIEMKIQKLNKVIEIRNQLINLQDDARVYTGLDKDTRILIYSTEDFLEIANHIKEKIFPGDISVHGSHELYFMYKGVYFQTFVLPMEYDKYISDISGGHADV